MKKMAEEEAKEENRDGAQYVSCKQVEHGKSVLIKKINHNLLQSLYYEILNLHIIDHELLQSLYYRISNLHNSF